jgi:Predicted transcriptional regulators
MFKDNLKVLRTEKGLSQEVLAERLHIVRQTISKWEKGLSVPDAEMLIHLADVLGTSVATLLGSTIEITDSSDKQIISVQLEQLNAMLAEKNNRSRRIWKVVSIALIVVLLIPLVLFILVYMLRVQF